MIKSEWEKMILPPHVTIHEALQHIDVHKEKLIFIVDENKCLQGAVTDGNIRRALLKGAKLTDFLQGIMNIPITTTLDTSAEQALELMIKHDITHLPAVDLGKIFWVWSKRELQDSAPLPNPVVIMAGGLGSRLGSLTKDTPKPMLAVGGRPILEILLENFIKAGFFNFYISVNYKAEYIKKYFGHGSAFGCNIEYLHEKERLGTAGSLSLLPSLEVDFLVVNADLLTYFNPRILFAHHSTKNTSATMLVKNYKYKVPFGVVESDNQGRLLAIREKPETSYQVAAGMYVLDPQLLNFVPKHKFFDMPDLLSSILSKNMHISTMATDSYWLDIGRPADFELAQREYH